MNKIALVLLVLLASSSPSVYAADLVVGSAAPPFSLQGSDGKTYSLADFAGKEGVVLAWFPKAFTGGCTSELKSVTDSAAELGAYKAMVFMVSFDPPDKNAEFAKSLDSKVVLLSNPKGDVASAYGVSILGALYAKRWTFYIDTAGTIIEIDKDVKTASAGPDMVKKLEKLGYPKR